MLIQIYTCFEFINVEGFVGIAKMAGSSKRKVTGEVGVTTATAIASEADLGAQSCFGPGRTTDDELLLESPSQKARSIPLAQSDNPIEIAVVSPMKPSKSFFVMNTQNGAIEQFSNLLAAKSFKETLVTFGQLNETTVLIDEFDSHVDARSFLKTKYNVDSSEQEEARKMIVDAKLSALAEAQSGPKAASINDCSEIVVLEDDDVPYRPVTSDTARSTASLTSQSPQMTAFAAATIGLGTSIAVMRWRLPACRYHVYAFKLLDGKELYWSHKPTMWMYAVQTERDAPIFIPADNMTLHKALNHCNSAGIRASPGGANTILTIKTQRTNKVIEQYLLYGLVQAIKTNEDIGDLIKSFVRHCEKTMVREAYHVTIREKMQSPAISDDTKPTGKYWIKLASGARNIMYEEKQRLNDVFLDQEIETIINLAYNTPAVPAQNWLPHIRDAAFGRSQSST